MSLQGRNEVQPKKDAELLDYPSLDFRRSGNSGVRRSHPRKTETPNCGYEQVERPPTEIGDFLDKDKWKHRDQLKPKSSEIRKQKSGTPKSTLDIDG